MEYCFTALRKAIEYCTMSDLASALGELRSGTSGDPELIEMKAQAEKLLKALKVIKPEFMIYVRMFMGSKSREVC